MTVDRRLFFAATATGAAALGAAPSALADGTSATSVHHPGRYRPGEPGRDYQPVEVPGGRKIPFWVVDGVKVFHLVIGEADQQMAPGLTARVWGFNGWGAGTCIEAVEGDTVRIFVTNRLGAPTAVHWHGVLLPAGMDGVGGLTQPNIPPGETWVYDFPLVQHGTLMFHAHHDEMVQMGLGLTGLFIIHPRRVQRRVDRDYAFLLHEWKIRPGARRPDPTEMTEFNIFTLNGKVWPDLPPMEATLGEKVRVRFGNLGMQNHHPMHIHGFAWTVTETDGGVIPEAGRWQETTVLVPVGTTRTVEFVADRPGDWAMHCHMLHHVMNQMGHGGGASIGVSDRAMQDAIAGVVPEAMVMGEHGMGDHGSHVASGHMPVPDNSIPMVGGEGPFGPIPMGGLVQIIKVRAPDTPGSETGWYDHPEGTVARAATPAELAANSIDTEPSRP